MNTAAKYQALVGCFAINFLLAGAARLSSILFVESMPRYNVNRKQASFPYILTYMMRHLSGPVVGYLVQIFGMQSTILTGCIFSTISVGACFFAEDILAVTLLWGMTLGFSFGLAHHMLPSILNNYFPSRGSTANGFSLAGACVGGIILPIILEASLQSYGLSGSFLLLSAIIAHGIPAALLIKDIEKRSTKKQKNKNTSVSKEREQTDKICIEILALEQTKIENMLPKIPPPPPYDIPTSKTENIPDPLFLTSKLENSLESDCSIAVKNKNNINNGVQSKEEKSDTNKKFTFENFTIFTDSAYFIILIINSGSIFIVTTVWTIILDFARDKGVEPTIEIYFVVCLPLSDLVGRIGSGFVFDSHFMQKSNMTVLCFLFTIFSLVAFVFVNNPVLILLCEFFVSLFLGAIFLLQIVLIQEFMEPQRRNMAMACRFILYAPISLLTSPMIGYFRGTQGSYDNVFYILCGISLFCGCSAYFIPHLVKRRKDPAINSSIN